jgi:cytochrome c oxidase subunit 2
VTLPISASLQFASILRVLEPASPQARSIVSLGYVVGIILAAIFVIVAAVIVYALMRFRWREGEGDPSQLAGNTKIEIIWTAIPCLIVVALFALTARAMGLADPPPLPEPDLIVTGHQWWWEISYPKSGVVGANEIHIPVGRAISVRLDSTDVLHEFWVPELSRKITAVPGHPNYLWIEADKAGSYLGICSEFCGTQHAWMHFLVVAESDVQFAAWEHSQLAVAPAPTADSAAKGLKIFEDKSCSGCHAINGTSTVARVGPDLSHFASRRQIGAGVVANTSYNLRRWLADPQEVKPGAKMPNFNLTTEELSHMVAYLETLK